jgi:PIN domain nuclease of toxin-antitoxin system
MSAAVADTHAVDRIIAATAVSMNLPLITRDKRIRALPIPTIW